MKKLLCIFVLLFTAILLLSSCDGLNLPILDNGDNSNDSTHVHEFGDWCLTKSPSCVNEGQETRYCSCGESQTKVIVPVGHKYQSTQASPTCTVKGYTTYTCACGDTYAEYVDALGHTYDNGVITTAPGCETKGIKTFTCGNCNDTYTEELDALGHSHDNGVITTDPGCENKGVKTFTCGRCNDSYTEDVKALGHCFDNGVITTEPGCETKGIKTFTCERCNGSYVEGVNAIGHSYTGVVTVEPGCETKGVKTFTCGGCSGTYTEDVNALGHSYDNGVITTAPKCLTKGVKTFTCGACSHAYTEDVNALGHTYVNRRCVACADIIYSQGITYVSNGDGTCDISGTDGFNETQLLIPSKSPAGDTVVKIAAYAFENLSAVTEVLVPDTVKTIEEGAFKGCNSITDITLPFVGTSKSASSYGSLFGYIFGFEDNVHSPVPGTVYQYSYSGGSYNYNFYWCYYIPQTIKNITITSQTEIPSRAFQNCDFVETITLCLKTETIGNNAFHNCSKLVEIDVGTRLISIGDYAFTNCSALEAITLPDTVTNLGKYVFDGCTSLSKMSSTEEGTIVLPTALSIIPSYAFQNCLAIKNVVVGNITEIQSNAFSGCQNIVKFNSDVAGELIVPSGVTSIGEYAFCGLPLITKIVISDTVKNIGNSTFKGCILLEDITLPFVGRSANESDTIYSGFGYIFGSVYGTNLNVSSDATLHYSEYYSYTGYTYRIYYFIPKTIRSVTITSQTDLPNRAFYNCDFIETITIESDIKSIQENTFYNCSNLANIEIPDSVNTIGNYAFYNCKKLLSVGVLNKVTAIGDYAFYDCTKLVSFVIPSTLNSMGKEVFRGCKSLTILCAFTTQPSAWNSTWNTSNCPVAWGYVAQEKTYSFVTNGAPAIDPIKSAVCIVLPTPVRDGYYFAGWYDNAEFSGTPLQFAYYSNTAHTLYAKWLTEEEWLAQNDGTSFAMAYKITLSQPVTVVIDTQGEDVYYKFTATINGVYTFTSSGELDTHCYLYNDSYEKVAYVDDNGSDRNFLVTYSMQAGQTVYLKVGSPSISATGTFLVIVA